MGWAVDFSNFNNAVYYISVHYREDIVKRKHLPTLLKNVGRKIETAGWKILLWELIAIESGDFGCWSITLSPVVFSRAVNKVWSNTFASGIGAEPSEMLPEIGRLIEMRYAEKGIVNSNNVKGVV